MSMLEEIVKRTRLERTRRQQEHHQMLQMSQTLYPSLSQQTSDGSSRRFGGTLPQRDEEDEEYYYEHSRDIVNDLSRSSLLRLHRNNNMNLDARLDGGRESEEHFTALIQQYRRREEPLERAMEVPSASLATSGTSEEYRSSETRAVIQATARQAERTTDFSTLKQAVLRTGEEISQTEQRLILLRRKFELEKQALVQFIERHGSLGTGQRQDHTAGHQARQFGRDALSLSRFLDERPSRLHNDGRGMGDERLFASPGRSLGDGDDAVSRRRWLDDNEDQGQKCAKRFKSDFGHQDSLAFNGTAPVEEDAKRLPSLETSEDMSVAQVLEKMQRKKAAAAKSLGGAPKLRLLAPKTPLKTGEESYDASPGRASASSSAIDPPQTVPTIPLTTNAETGGISVAIPSDKGLVSSYQTLVRTSLEFFTAKAEDVAFGVQGRKKEIYAGQVGVRCKFCANRPTHWRNRGSTYYPGKLSGVYQAAQNMAVTHLLQHCTEIPDDLKKTMGEERRNQKILDRRGGGKKYWVESCRKMGLRERDGQLGIFWA